MNSKNDNMKNQKYDRTTFTIIDNRNGRRVAVRVVPGIAGFAAAENGTIYSALGSTRDANWIEGGGDPRQLPANVWHRIKPRSCGSDYARVLVATKYIDRELWNIKEDSAQSNVRIHRMVAAAWLSEFDAKTFRNLVVNHKNFNTLWNAASNLELITTAENVRYSRDGGRYGKNRGQGVNARRRAEAAAMRARREAMVAVA